MSDYIKREDAYKYLDEQLVEVFTGDTLLGALKQIIAKLPSADAVEVVRCKDCKFWNKDENILGGICDEWSDFEDSIINYTKPDDYCSRGEQKEEENESRNTCKR